jgi:hypothetical protein
MYSVEPIFGAPFYSPLLSPFTLFATALELAFIRLFLYLVKRLSPILFQQILPYQVLSHDASNLVNSETNFRNYLQYESGHPKEEIRLSNRIRTIMSIDDRIEALRSRASIMLLCAIGRRVYDNDFCR